MNDEDLLKKIIETLEIEQCTDTMPRSDKLNLARSLRRLFLEEHAIRITSALSLNVPIGPYNNMTPEEFSKSWSL